MDIRPIKNDEDHTATLREIERLWGSAPNTNEGDRLDVLLTLVEAYEDRRWPVPDADPVDVLHYAIEEMGKSRAELGHIIGRSRATEILSRQRRLTLDMIRSISEAWHLPIASLARPYEIERQYA